MKVNNHVRIILKIQPKGMYITPFDEYIRSKLMYLKPMKIFDIQLTLKIEKIKNKKNLLMYEE
jgi:hypothetical protein